MNDISEPRATSAKPMLMAVFAVLAACAAFVILFITGGDRAEGPDPSTEMPAVGKKLVQIRLEPLVGNPPPLSHADLSGKVVLINFWGPWCAYCRMEMPHLVELNDRLKTRDDFRFVSISCSAAIEDEDLEQLRKESEDYLEGRGYQFPVHCDPRGATRQSVVQVADLGSSGIAYPMTIVLDREGVIRGFFPGYHSEIGKELNEIVDKLLASG